MTQKERYSAVINWFEQNRPDAETELHYHDPFQLLVAVMLSAQCTDKRVNLVTPALFAAYPDPASMAQATTADLLRYMGSVSYPNSKALHLQQMSQKLLRDFGGQVPQTLEELTSLPGVGRKTANVVMSVAFGQARMAVDTHVFRVAERIGLTRGSKSPLQTELTLVRHIPEHLIGKAHHWLILHGRYVCQARKPLCDQCGLTACCRHYREGNRTKME